MVTVIYCVLPRGTPCYIWQLGTLDITSVTVWVTVSVSVMAHLFPLPLIHDTRQCFQTNIEIETRLEILNYLLLLWERGDFYMWISLFGLNIETISVSMLDHTDHSSTATAMVTWKSQDVVSLVSSVSSVMMSDSSMLIFLLSLSFLLGVWVRETTASRARVKLHRTRDGL